VGGCRREHARGGVATEATAAAWTLTQLEEEHAQLLRLLDPGCLYRQVAEELRQATGLDIAMVAPLDESGRVVIRYFSGAVGRSLHEIVVPVGRGLGGQVLASGRPAAVDDYYTADSITHEFDRQVREEGIRAIAAVPIPAADGISGILYAGLRHEGSIGDRAISTIRSYSKSMCVALEAQRQASAATAAQVTLERRRTASELHDSVGAMLFRIGAEVRDLRSEFTANPDTAARLARLEERVSEASAALRQALSALRDTPEDDELGMAVQCQCRSFEANTGIAARAIVLGRVGNLRSSRQDVLRRVLREALLNVEKHAEASSVFVSLGAVDGGVTLVVSDDGVGCSSPAGDRCGIGLASVGEEVAQVGGTIGVVSNEEGGTTLRAWVPCL
jgi:signal transduction histidine kinase